MQSPAHVSTGINIFPDSSRVIVRSFIPGDHQSVLRIIQRALLLSEDEIVARIAYLHEHFDERHPCLECSWRSHYEHVRRHVPHETSLSQNHRLYIGSLFSGEYALESAALFNPSIVAHPDQTGVESGSLRYIMSLRATGEGHISSIAFRTGISSEDGTVSFHERPQHISAPDLNPDPTFSRGSFFRKLRDMEFDNQWSKLLKDSLGDRFTRSELDAAVHTSLGSTRSAAREARRTIECINWLAHVNYEVKFDPIA